MTMKPPTEVVSFAFKHPETGKVNIPQCTFYDTVMKSVAGLLGFRYFFYGGAIRGGKTYVCLFIFVMLARLFPGSRWHIFRSDFPELEDTTIPSMEKLIGRTGKDFVWKRKSSNYHILFSNGSKIFFKSENALKDPDLKWMLGLETNGILIEQMEGVTEKLFDRAVERVGSWYIVPIMPPPLILGTFNPTDTWVKKKIYDNREELPEDWFYQEALPTNNPFVTEEQWKNWQNLDPISYNQLIKSVWVFLNDAKLFAYSFDQKKHVVDINTKEGAEFMKPTKKLPIILIFDFNVDPMTCLVAQADGMRWCKIIREYRLRNSDIFEMLHRIKTDWIAAGYYVIATGDASGRARQGAVKGKRSFVKIIAAELNLSPRQLQFPPKNPSVADTRIILNSVLHNHDNFHIASDCLFTIDDLATVKVDDTGEIDKKKNALKTHLLDNVRYLVWRVFRGFVRI